MKRVAWVLLAITLLSPLAAHSETIRRLLFSRDSWEVDAVKYDDGLVACVAGGADDSKSFSVWAFLEAKIVFRFQFFDVAWEPREKERTSIRVQVDSNGVWDVKNAELYEQSVVLELHDENSSSEFIAELAEGSTIHMISEDSNLSGTFSLVGAGPSLVEFKKCWSALAAGTDLFAGN